MLKLEKGLKDWEQSKLEVLCRMLRRNDITKTNAVSSGASIKMLNPSRIKTNKKIWIDLDNSPHVPFFKPIIMELNKHGFEVFVTARDCFQVCGLADLFKLEYKKVGRHYGKSKLLKVIGTLTRAMQLAPAAITEKPDLALSHGSRSQLILASLLKIPSVIIFDYEHARMITRPSWVIVPEVIPDTAINLDRERILKYPGIKEDVYVPAFRIAENIRDELNISEDEIIITVRPPANEAHYHNPKSEDLYIKTIEFLCTFKNTRIVILPRNNRQKVAIEKRWLMWLRNNKMLIPEHVINGLSLIWHSDLVISGGGTMNREAAALGVPVYSIFRGKLGAVDRYLADTGRLVLLKSEHEIPLNIIVEKRARSATARMIQSASLESIIKHIVMVAEFHLLPNVATDSLHSRKSIIHCEKHLK